MNEETLFHLALEAPVAARDRLLDEECGGDDALRQRLLALLAAHDNPRSFLLRPPAALVDSLSTACTADSETESGPALGPGSVVGPYRLLRKIGEGGMGAVYAAEQTQPVRRVVALKLIKLGMDTKQVIARFEAERQALAVMDHPNIARVFDAGATDAGRPYFVMEIVDGVPLTRFCEEARLGLKERLELFASVCHAVQHAHQKGVIHRDLKPGNVLVARYDGQPTVKVIDFGIAKATGPRLTGPTLFTEFGAIVGTLEYMAPEQAELNQMDVDTRSDVYSLGVLLYELLTGTTPFLRERLQEVGLLQVLRIIREEEPPPPSRRLAAASEPCRWAGQVRGELDWIVMKCLEKDRDRRYETANGLADDVRRYLNEEPVRAGPPTFGYRARKFLRRHRRALATAAVLGLGVLLAAGSVGWVARDRAARTAATEREVELELKEVVRLHHAGKGQEAFAAVRRAEAMLFAGEASEATRSRVREWRVSLDLVNRLEEIRFKQGWELGGDYSQVESSYRQAFHELGLDFDALSPEEAARRITASAIKEQVLAALDEWAGWKAKSRRPGGSERLLEVARLANPGRERYLAAFRKQDRTQLLALARDPVIAELPPSTALQIARALAKAGLTRTAVEVCQRSQRRHPGDMWLNLELAGLLRSGPNRADAAGYLRAFLAARPTSAPAHIVFATYMADMGRLTDAEFALTESIRLQPDSGDAHHQLGLVWNRQNRLPEAESAFREACRLSPGLCYFHYYLADCLIQQGRLTDAEAPLREAVRLRPTEAFAQVRLGDLLARLGKFSEAVLAYREAIQLQPDNGLAHANLAMTLHEMGESEAGLDELAVADDASRTLVGIVWGEASPGPIENRFALADQCAKRRLNASAARFFAEAFAADSRLAADPKKFHRYNAACCAAMAGGALGADVATLTEEGRYALRHRALAWLRDDLTAWGALVEKEPLLVARQMQHWLRDEDFAGVRGDTALVHLPDAERSAWQRLWSDVVSLRQKAERAKVG